MEPNSNRKLEIVGLVVLVVLGVGFATNTSYAQGFLDWLRGLRSTTIQNIQTPVSLYKPVIDYENAVMTAVKKASPAVVSITVSRNVSIVENCPRVSPFFNIPPEFRDLFEPPQTQGECRITTELREVGGGSGFIVDPSGLILTNKHVVSDTSASYSVFTNDGKTYDAQVLARHPIQDLAILKIEDEGLPVVELGDSSGVDLGQTAIAIGNTLGEYRNTVSVGVISGLSRTITASGAGTTERLEGILQTDAAISQGNSGGPLLNLKGEVIGINTAVSLEGQNIGFAIPINRAKQAIASVQRTGEIHIPYIGVRYVTVTPEIVRQENLAVDYGALVQASGRDPAVMPDSPASRAGLQAGDVILEMDGRRLSRDNSLADVLSEYSVGQSAALKVMRQSEEMNLNIVLEERP